MCNNKCGLNRREETKIDDAVRAHIRRVYLASRMPGTHGHMQHGKTSVPTHCLAVAYYSDRLLNFLSRRTGKAYRREELIRGALLHDYFLYDWHDGDPARRIHGFTHPAAAWKNAAEDFALTDVERDIIEKHMFPLTPAPPRYLESAAVCVVDKILSIYEVFVKNTYPSLSGAFHWGARLASGEEGE